MQLRLLSEKNVILSNDNLRTYETMLTLSSSILNKKKKIPHFEKSICSFKEDLKDKYIYDKGKQKSPIASRNKNINYDMWVEMFVGFYLQMCSSP